MEHVDYLIVGAGMSGLAVADRLGKQHSYLVLEADSEVGGYCKTIQQDGFVWDYSGHFFHFRHPEIEAELVSRMSDQRILEDNRRLDKKGRKLRGASWRFRHKILQDADSDFRNGGNDEAENRERRKLHHPRGDERHHIRELIEQRLQAAIFSDGQRLKWAEVSADAQFEKNIFWRANFMRVLPDIKRWINENMH